MLGLAGLGLAFLYPYVIYPLLLRWIRKPERVEREPERWPRVAILVSAYNEERHIAGKVENFRALDYPPELVEMWIGLDGSTDGTAARLREIAEPRVKVVERRERSGKTAVLNDLASRAEAEILMFTDTNPRYLPGAVRAMARRFADPRVGLVSGQTRIRGGGNVEVEGLYYRFEHWLKERESWGGWLAGALGPNYGMRAKLYRPLEEALINDLAHPLEVARAGYRCEWAGDSMVEEEAGEEAGREFFRQTRMTAQGAYVLARGLPGLVAAGCWGMVWVLLSHKLLRWMAGLWLVLGVAYLGYLAWEEVWARVMLGAVAAGLAALGYGWRRGARWAKMPGFFLLVQGAYLWALWQALRGERYVTWKPRAGQ